MSMGSLLVHLSMTKFSSMDLVQYTAKVALSQDFPSVIGTQGPRNKKLWGPIKPLELLQPYANPNPSDSFPAPNKNSNGFIYAKVFGGFEKIKSSICDLVIIARLLNATLVLPDIQQSVRSKGVSRKFKSFSYLYDEEQFITSLMNDVTIVSALPANLKAARKKNEFPSFKPNRDASPEFYLNKILPKLISSKVVGLIISDGGCLQSILPHSMLQYQQLRCRVAFHALQFRPEIQLLGHRMVQRLQAWGQPFLAYHPGLLRDTLAYHGCAELFQDVHTELIQYRRAQMIKQGIVKGEISVDSHLIRDRGSCPFMPEEAGLLLRAMGYQAKTIIYLAGSENFGGQRVLIPLRAMFPNLVDLTSLCSKQELSDLLGPESSLPEDQYKPPPAKSEKQLKEEWNKAGPRPRPLPPPPDRPIYVHEKTGWYGWITETDKEPDPSPMDLRMQAHRLIWDALDYIVSVEADAFFPGFNNDGSGWPDFSSLVMGQRLYESAASRTYRPDRKVLADLFNTTRENMYHPKHNWTLTVREHLNRSLGEYGIIRQSLLSKPVSFLSHPLPECSCRIPSADATKPTKSSDGRILYGGEEECPKWMLQSSTKVFLDSSGADNESPEDESDEPEQQDSDDKTSTSLPFDRDDEWDPND
ncbi:hypothetical protein ACFE04_028007 [Oxalis oulophora]